MSACLFPPAAQPAVPAAGEDVLFPVRGIYRVGRTSAARRRERGGVGEISFQVV